MTDRIKEVSKTKLNQKELETKIIRVDEKAMVELKKLFPEMSVRQVDA